MALRSLLDGALLAETFGEGTPRVLALHGWGRRGNDFAQALRGIPSLAPDLPGFGASPPPDSVYGAAEYAKVISRALGLFAEPPVVVGHSFGGRVAVCLAAGNPGLVGPLVLSGVPLLRLGPNPKPSWSYRLARMGNRVGLLTDERMERLRRSRGSADYRAASGVMRDILVKVINESYQEQLGRIPHRVRLVWGSDDREVPVQVAEAAGRMLPNSQLEVLEGVGHFVPSEAPARLNAIIREELG